jgi:hypothetical protein
MAFKRSTRSEIKVEQPSVHRLEQRLRGATAVAPGLNVRIVDSEEVREHLDLLRIAGRHR